MHSNPWRLLYSTKGTCVSDGPKNMPRVPSVKKSATQRGLFVVALCSQRGLFLYRGGKFDVPNMAILFIISFRMNHPYLDSLFAPLCHSQSFTKQMIQCDITSIQLDCFCWPSELHSLKVTAKAREKKHHLPQKNISNENSNRWNSRTNFRWLHVKEC